VQLGAGEVGQILPTAFAWWRRFAARYVASLCLHAPNVVEDASSPPILPEVAPPDAAELASLVRTAPMMPGSEYLTPDVLLTLWAAMGATVSAALASAKTDLQGFLKGLNPAWNLVGRVHFNLAENCRDPAFPFAFMATYTTQLSAQAKAQHLPLSRALQDYTGAANRQKLLALLVAVHFPHARDVPATIRRQKLGRSRTMPPRKTSSTAAPGPEAASAGSAGIPAALPKSPRSRRVSVSSGMGRQQPESCSPDKMHEGVAPSPPTRPTVHKTKASNARHHPGLQQEVAQAMPARAGSNERGADRDQALVLAQLEIIRRGLEEVEQLRADVQTLSRRIEELAATMAGHGQGSGESATPAVGADREGEPKRASGKGRVARASRLAGPAGTSDESSSVEERGNVVERQRDPGDAVPPGVAVQTPAPLTTDDNAVLHKLEKLPKRVARPQTKSRSRK